MALQHASPTAIFNLLIFFDCKNHVIFSWPEFNLMWFKRFKKQVPLCHGTSTLKMYIRLTRCHTTPLPNQIFLYGGAQIHTDINHLKGFFLGCSAGLLWSFGALIIRYMIEAQTYRWQYLFFRGLTIASVLSVYILLKEGRIFIRNFIDNGVSGLLNWRRYC